MFAGFNLRINSVKLFDEEEYYTLGRSINEKNKKNIKENLESFVVEGVINGTSLQNEWFPQVKADIFISHSHQDERLAFCLMGWLSKHFSLAAFVDSNVWGFADDLLKIIDDKYCINNGGDHKTYSYEKRNYSTSHVHMMLSVALNKMIDKTECLFFLNTPQSASIKDTVESEIFSPWIYSELFTSSVIRKQELSKYRKGYIEKKALFEAAELTVSYKVRTDHLIDIEDLDLLKWRKEKLSGSSAESLDQLYYLKGLLGIR